MSFSFGFSGDDVDDGTGDAEPVAPNGGGSNGAEQFDGMPAVEHSLDELVGTRCLFYSIPIRFWSVLQAMYDVL